MKGYVLDYIDENEYHKLERALKKYNMIAFKKLNFDYYPALRNGEFVGELVSQNKKVILWCIFTGTIRKFSDRLSSLNISNTVIYGDVSDVERNENLASFKRGNVDVLITNPHTLAESVSLHNVCHDAIYYEYSYNLVHLLQSKDRIHRLGLSNGQYTQFYFMGLRYSEVSLDRNIYDRLKEKERNMLDSIDKNKLENVYATTDDISFILKNII